MNKNKLVGLMLIIFFELFGSRLRNYPTVTVFEYIT